MMNKNPIPKYVQEHCKTRNEISIACSYIMHKACPGTCAYVKYITSLGIGANVNLGPLATKKRLETNLGDWEDLKE